MPRPPRCHATAASRRRLWALTLGVLTAACVLASSGGANARSSAQQARAAAAAAQLRVVQVEYRLILSSGAVKAGPVDLEEIDRGLDPHDLRLQSQGSSSVYAAPLLTPGHNWDGTVNLKPGVYRLWCSLPEHAPLGMHTTLRVVR